MKDLRISIVYICDEKYVMPTCVSIQSIYENKKDSAYDIYIIGVDLSQKSKNKINSIKLSSINIHLLAFENKYKDLNTTHVYVSKAALFKFDIPNILSGLDKVLYIDSDTIVQDDLAKLFNTDIDQYYAGVVSNSKPYYKGDCAELCLNDYFNSGVMLLNLKTLRENNTPDKLYQDKLSRATRFMDQDCFNKIFAGHIKFLDPKSNYLTVYSNAYPKNLMPYIVHFASEKPWEKFDVKYGRSWDKYYLKSNFGGGALLSRKYIYKEKIGDKRIIYIFGIKISYKKKIKKVKKFCPICNNMNIFDDYGTELRHNSKCPVCDSLERHRFLSFIYKFEFLSNKMPKTILHIAPEKSIYNLLSNVRNIEYYSVDISPEQYPYAKNIIKADVLNLPFEDKKFDIIISNQVIEHIKDEGKFIKELARALKDEGKIILNLPYDPNIKDVFQDSSICSPEDKLYYYGQHDHEKIYGQKLIADYDNLNINRISEKDYFSEYLINLMGLQREGGRLRDAYLLITKNV